MNAFQEMNSDEDVGLAEPIGLAQDIPAVSNGRSRKRAREFESPEQEYAFILRRHRSSGNAHSSDEFMADLTNMTKFQKMDEEQQCAILEMAREAQVDPGTARSISSILLKFGSNMIGKIFGRGEKMHEDAYLGNVFESVIENALENIPLTFSRTVGVGARLVDHLILTPPNKKDEEDNEIFMGSFVATPRPDDVRPAAPLQQPINIDNATHPLDEID